MQDPGRPRVRARRLETTATAEHLRRRMQATRRRGLAGSGRQAVGALGRAVRIAERRGCLAMMCLAARCLVRFLAQRMAAHSAHPSGHKANPTPRHARQLFREHAPTGSPSPLPTVPLPTSPTHQIKASPSPPAPGSRSLSVSALSSTLSHRARTHRSAAASRHPPVCTPAPSQTPPPTATWIFVLLLPLPAYSVKGHGASGCASGSVVSLDRFMCDALGRPEPLASFSLSYCILQQ